MCILIAAVAKPEIIKIGQSSHKMYCNNIVDFQESTTILNTCSKKSGNLLNTSRICACATVSVCVCVKNSDL